MRWNRNMLVRKNGMALTGLFLCFFLVVHLLGNLQLLLPEAEARARYNWYSHLLAGNWLIEIVALALYASILLHLVDGIYLAIKSKRAAGNPYNCDRRRRASTWHSRNMMLLGLILLAFLVIHFKDFWYRYKFGALPVDENGYRDLYSLVVAAFGELWYVVLYTIALIALGYHLLHGVFSAYRTLGLYHPVYTRAVKVAGALFAMGIALGFAIIPIFIYLKQRV